MLSLKFINLGFEILRSQLNSSESILVENDPRRPKPEYLLICTSEGEYRFKEFFELHRDRYYVPSQIGEFKGYKGMKNLGGIANYPSLFNISSCFDVVDDKYTPDYTKSTELQHLYWIIRKELFEENINNSLNDYYQPFSEQGKELLAEIINIQSKFIEAFGSDYHDDTRFDDEELLPVVEDSCRFGSNTPEDTNLLVHLKHTSFKDSESFNFDNIDSAPFTIGRFPQLHTYVKLKDGTIGILWRNNTENNTIHVIIEREWDTPRGNYDPEFITYYQFNRSDIAIENDDLSEVKKTCEFDINPIEVKCLNGRF